MIKKSKKGVEYEWLLAIPSKDLLDEYRDRYIRDCLENGGLLTSYTGRLESIYIAELYESKLRNFGCNIISLKQKQYLKELL